MFFLSDHLSWLTLLFAVVIRIVDASSYKYAMSSSFVYYCVLRVILLVTEFALFHLFRYWCHLCLFSIAINDCGCYNFTLCSVLDKLVHLFLEYIFSKFIWYFIVNNSVMARPTIHTEYTVTSRNLSHTKNI